MECRIALLGCCVALALTGCGDCGCCGHLSHGAHRAGTQACSADGDCHAHDGELAAGEAANATALAHVGHTDEDCHEVGDDSSGSKACELGENHPFVAATTFGEAIERMSSCRTRIKSSFAAGTPTKAHDALDELCGLVKQLMPLARSSGIAKTQWRDLNLAAQQLNEVCQSLHEGLEKHRATEVYAEVSTQFEASFEVITAASGQPARVATRPE